MDNNKIHRVVILVTSCFLVYFSASILSYIYGWKFEAFDKINLVSDIFKKSEEEEQNESGESAIAGKTTEKPAEEAAEEDFDLYKKPEFITNFHKGDSIVALPILAQKLTELKNTGKGKIRIAYFGDSMIEGDLITQTLRKLLQQEFGGQGVGFLPMHSNVAQFRQTARVSGTGWESTNFMTPKAQNMYISGHTFRGAGSGTYQDRTLTNDALPIQKYILYGKTESAEIEIDGVAHTLQGHHLVNRKTLADNTANTLKIKSKTSSLPLFGVGFESENGIILDNFSFRGITGVELSKINEEFLKSIQEANPYDLIVFQYGVNLLFRPKDTNYSHYEKMMQPILSKMRNAFPKTDFLLVSTADRAFRYGGEYKTAIGIPNLIQTQARLAFDNKMAFYNQFESMGGENSIVRWATQSPPLANKDYIHPNGKGAEVLAEKIYNAIIQDYKKYKRK